MRKIHTYKFLSLHVFTLKNAFTIEKPPTNHIKNTKSLKFDQGKLKAMLTDKMNKRYELNPKSSAKRTLENIDLYAKTQRNSQVHPKNILSSKASIPKFSQKKQPRRRKSSRGSQDNSQRRISK